MEPTKTKSVEDMAWDCLRRMKDPSTKEDIVSLGIVTEVHVSAGSATVHLTPPQGDPYQHEALAQTIRHDLISVDGIDRVRVGWPKAQREDLIDPEDAGAVHLPVLETQPSPHSDVMDPVLQRANLAPDAGYGEFGPEDLPGPVDELPQDKYEGWPPVFQWEMDPADPSLKSGETHARRGDWDFDIWWQEHPAGLLYVAIQAMRDDTVTEGPERQHPMGRNVVVNLVYDQRRGAVVAVYGTARDFRPFVEVFRDACGIKSKSQESNE